MSDDSDFDEVAHDELLLKLGGKKTKTKLKKATTKLDVDDLLGSIKTKSQSLNSAKKLTKKDKSKKTTLATPLHRQEKTRIQSAVASIELNKELQVWQDVVEKNRLADQLQFPLNQQSIMTVEKAADRTENFTPRTDFEKRMAEMLNSSKHNLTNDTVYTEAELEVIRAMDVEEAKSKLDAIRKMRALVSYREAKYRYAAKIKSKGYHRILKREKRKQLIKEFDDLLVRDPEAAKKKLEELEQQRVLERGSLKHRARTKFAQVLTKHAAHDPNAKRILEDQLKLGRDLKSKVGMEEESDDETTTPSKAAKVSVADMIRNAALDAADGEDTPLATRGLKMSREEGRVHLFQLRQQKRLELEKARVSQKNNAAVAEEPEPETFEINEDWLTPTSSSKQSGEDLGAGKSSKKSKKSKTQRLLEESPAEIHTIDEIFESAEGQLSDSLRKRAAVLKELEDDDETPVAPVKRKRNSKTAEKPAEEEADIALDPTHFLQVETANLTAVSSDLVEKMDEFESEKDRLIAEAFQDDDVVGEFDDEKELIEEGERPKDVDLTLSGWGSWVGPGVTENKRRKRFIIKARANSRKDKGKRGVIIHENKSESAMQKLQPHSLPFPYTRVEDFEAVVKQPIGKDWNPISVTSNLCKPSVVTQGGRSIRPMSKKDTLEEKLVLS